MSRTITVDTGKELLGFIDNLVESGSYKTKSEVVREGLRLLKEQQASSKLEALRQLIDDGENSGDLSEWNVDTFLNRMKAKTTDDKR
ncbi:type II toxin-antitoxin system ParD family antitoxin [uncultured Cocleimonas sp.]|uniref:type II toxin-antitoxin system ParD family antitoxin n=1 Tax=uncultured Cocleimonas sp. TaxID=1051587 RepID=UPI0026367B3A|nr:type II toxin-antitoxin system ParD family antitoxin [uncultured Cocleimonas sp.]